MLERNVLNRQKIAKHYQKRLSKLLGLDFQEIEKNSRSSYKDFAIVIYPSNFGCTHDNLFDALNSENIMTKNYFYPAIHQQDAFKPYIEGEKTNLKVTKTLANNILYLPIYSHI